MTPAADAAVGRGLRTAGMVGLRSRVKYIHKPKGRGRGGTSMYGAEHVGYQAECAFYPQEICPFLS